nr:MAG TPA: hypothetical protein [Caudoviricetes sp.]
METEKVYDRKGAFVWMFFTGIVAFFSGFALACVFGPYSMLKKAVFVLFFRLLDQDAHEENNSEVERNAINAFFTKPYKVKITRFRDL